MFTKIFTLVCACGGLIYSSCYGYAHTQIVVENNCSMPVSFSIKNINNTDNLYEEVKNLSSYTYKTIAEVNNDSFISKEQLYKIEYVNDTSKSQLNGSVIYHLNNYTINPRGKSYGGNDAQFDGYSGGISVDANSTPMFDTWRNYSVTGDLKVKTFIVTACSESIDIPQREGSILDKTERILIFGDSLSDKGLLYNMATVGGLPRSTPYNNGMFSNGLVWSKILANKLKNNSIEVSNYSVGGSTVLTIVPWTTVGLPHNLSNEITTYGLDSNAQKTHSDRKIAIFFTGANDYLTTSEEKLSSRGYETHSAVKKVVDELISQIDNVSARVKVVIGLPNLANTIESQKLNNQSILSEMTEYHNSLLMEFAKSRKEVIFIDINKVFSEAISDTENFNKEYNMFIDKGLLGKRCWNYGYTDAPSIDRKPCEDPNKYLFWDEVHPTYQMHRALYKYILSELGATTSLVA